MSGREESEGAVELYFSTPMSTRQVVEHLGYPTGQCPGTVAARRSQVCGCRCQASRTVGARCRAVELCLSGMQQKQVATELGVSAGAVHHWMRLYRAGGMAAPETGTEGCHAAGRNR